MEGGGVHAGAEFQRTKDSSLEQCDSAVAGEKWMHSRNVSSIEMAGGVDAVNAGGGMPGRKREN